MKLAFSAADEAFRADVRGWLGANLMGEFAQLRGVGGPGSEHEAFEGRLAWERRLAEDGWTCLGWPEEHGGRDLPIARQVIFHEEYARADAPARVGIFGEGLLGPTLIAFGTADQQKRFLPPIRRAEELWCQGYSEPDAGSDLANVQTVAELDGAEWVITGQKVWTSLATWADWCFALCRTTPLSRSEGRSGPGEVPKHRGISYLLVPMKQPTVEVRPIVQLTGTSEFNEVFFDGARTAAENVVGDVDGGWRVAMGTLAMERGVFTLGQQVGFEREVAQVTRLAREMGRADDPLVRQRLAAAWIGLRLMRVNALRALARSESAAWPSITKLVWSTWHQELGRLAMDVLGPAGALAGAPLQRVFLFSRADTIYAGSSEIQRNLLGERALGLPRDPSPS